MNNNYGEVRPSAGNRAGLAHPVAVARHSLMMLAIAAGFMVMIAAIILAVWIAIAIYALKHRGQFILGM
jgi:hypothetical protein